MKTVLHKADTRGRADHGWLVSHHSFSFANHYDPERMGFGLLRVLNDDVVAPGRGFGTHPHDNMEIVSIPLSGALEHKDSMNNTAVIEEGDIQVLSAGTGIYHSEYNKSKEEKVRFLQIWIFPNKTEVEPRYDQVSIDKSKLNNDFLQILSPNKDDEGVWIYQDAWFNMADMEPGIELTYEMHNTENGVYSLVLEGEISIGDYDLSRRDALGIWDTSSFDILAREKATILLIEVPFVQ